MHCKFDSLSCRSLGFLGCQDHRGTRNPHSLVICPFCWQVPWEALFKFYLNTIQFPFSSHCQRPSSSKGVCFLTSLPRKPTNFWGNLVSGLPRLFISIPPQKVMPGRIYFVFLLFAKHIAPTLLISPQLVNFKVS